MRWNPVLALVAALACGCPALAHAEDKTDGPSPPASVPALTPQQFEALPPTAGIEVGGQRISKAEFLIQRETALKKAFDDMKAGRSRAAAEFSAQRKAFLDSEKAKLDEANKKVLAEVDRLRSADAALHGPNWDGRREQAAALLKEAATAGPVERSRLEKEADDLLAPASARP